MTLEGHGASRIADRIGCSESMVRRLRVDNGIPLPSTHPPGIRSGALSPQMVKNPKVKKRLNPMLEQFAAPVFLPREPGKGVSLFKLGSKHCRFPLGTIDEPARFFCGQPVDNSSFCTEHRGLCYGPAWSRVRA